MKSTKCLKCNGSISYNDSEGIEKALWCNMECKKRFLLNHYSLTQCKVWFAEHDKQIQKSKKQILKEIKRTGLTVTEYIQLLRD